MKSWRQVNSQKGFLYRVMHGFLRSGVTIECVKNKGELPVDMQGDVGYDGNKDRCESWHWTGRCW